MDIFGKFGKHYAWIIVCTLLVVAISLGLALILPQRENVLDFVTLYAANLGVVQRVPIYDTPALTNLMIAQLKLEPDFQLFPHPYPPWYALSTFFLAWLPPQKAANAWMLLNVSMLITCTALWTIKRKPAHRLLATLATLMFIPSLGLIVVGQYSAPVLLGASLFVYAVSREDAPLTVLALLLMTLKPHLGLFLFPACFAWLIFQKTPFARQVLILTLAGSGLLAALGFLADPTWPLTYARALLAYSNISGVASLGISAGFSAMLVKLVTGQGSAIWSTYLSLLIAAILLAIYWRFKLFNQLETLIPGCVLLTLLGDPYLLNYDYVLLLLPLNFLLQKIKNLPGRITLIVLYCVPWLSLLLERTADIFYAISALILLVFLLHNHQRKMIVRQFV